ncbi:imidazole glycerol phosphate synthase subunit HisH [Fodinibius salsisoli]|uniref:Imidazole glycerol phosphate synthase subunit HisH n=1 Tax=Fodinibius salsisoli TaxID=2820877 RepID=A0ABT3PS43_9BACT|nr:imidazole glycerol phosphate synthase subunit HisH [Fodinibius salsisoli]MCW9708674.1 imidazole glycerol phosphate synthase subunit HisH [Fodinibius salsisoli]
MIAIINYEAGNLASVSNALNRLDVPYTITNKTNELEAAEGIIFPGVGHAKPAMEALRKNGLDTWIQQTTKPLLGICLGMQLLYESSDEGGGTKGLGLIPGQLKKFDNSSQKVPHMGWNTFTETADHPLVSDFNSNSYFYYVHSYYAPVNEYTIATCNYSTDFTSVVYKDNLMGVQFHPEKSGKIGAQLLQRFIDHVENQKVTG